MRTDKEAPAEAQRAANVERVQRWWADYQKSDSVSAQAIEDLIRVAVLETVAPELVAETTTTPHQLVSA